MLFICFSNSFNKISTILFKKKKKKQVKFNKIKIEKYRIIEPNYVDLSQYLHTINT
jgi:hypothetical protein